MSLQAIIFDVDGTLAETEEQHRLSFNAAFAAAGLAWRWEPALYARLLEVTGGKERIAHFIELTDVTPALDAPSIAALHAAKSAHYAAAVAAGAVVLRPGIRRLLDDAAAAGILVAIATTTSPGNVDALLDVALGPGSGARFATIAAGDCVPRKKPAPEIYDLVLRTLGLSARSAIAIEDTVNGLRSARAAGLEVVITRSAYGGTEGFEQAAMQLDHLGDPGAPCRVIAGRPLDAGMVTIEALQEAVA